MVALVAEAFIVLWAAYLLVSLAGLFSEKSGVTNIGLNGIMVMGAMAFSMIMASDSIRDVFGAWTPFIGLIAGGLIGIVFSLLFGVFVISFYSDQVIVGTAINIVAAALSIIIIQSVYEQDFINFTVDNPIDSWTINIVYVAFLVIALIAIIISFIIFAKTRFGLRIKASGENPYALETSGVSVTKIRYQSQVISGLLAGMAGAIAMQTLQNNFEGTVNGMGYIALAILIFGQWKVVGIVIGSIIVAFLMAIGQYWLTFNINFPAEIIKMLPFVVPIIVMMITKTSNAPRAVGKPFKKDERV